MLNQEEINLIYTTNLTISTQIEKVQTHNLKDDLSVKLDTLQDFFFS